MQHKIFRRLLTVAAVSIIFTTLSELPLSAEAVYLKDGSVIYGTIVSTNAASFTLRLSDNKIKQILRGDINNILFVDEKNKTVIALDGEPGTDRVSITWPAPYDGVKKYNVYIRKNRSEKYELADTTGWRSVTVKNLTSKTDYYLMVRSIDSDNHESIAGNELKITTKNMVPEKPVITSADDTADGGRKYLWNASTDPDGKVEKYRIYDAKNDKREMIAEVRKTEYVLKNALSYDKIELVAVDDSGDESGVVNERVKDIQWNTYLGFSPGLIIPLGKKGEMYNIGYGGMLTLTERKLFIEQFEVGISAGFYYATGKDLLKENKPKYLDYMIIPILINTGYRIELPYSFSVIPTLSLGAAYAEMKYIKNDSNTFQEVEKKVSTIDPAVKCGLGVEYKINESISMSISGEYGVFIETGETIDFLVADIGIYYKF